MSKNQQRKDSALDLGKKTFIETKRIIKFKHYQGIKPNKPILKKLQGCKNSLNPFNKKNGLRKVWNAGWVIQLKMGSHE